MTETPIHRADIFRQGDRIPWKGDLAVVAERRVVDTLPDDLESHYVPQSYDPPETEDTDYVLLTLDTNGESILTTASWLCRNLSERYDGEADIKSPPVRSESETISFSTAAVGSRHLTPEEANDMAQMLRENAHRKGMQVLLQRADSPGDVHEVANALERAVLVHSYIGRKEAAEDTDE